MIKTNLNTQTVNHNISSSFRSAELALVAAIALATSVHMPTPNTDELKQAAGHVSAEHAERKEREEPGPHYASYGSMQRTAARSADF